MSDSPKNLVCALARRGVFLLPPLFLLSATGFSQAAPPSNPHALFVPAVPLPGDILHPIAVSDFQLSEVDGDIVKLHVLEEVWNYGNQASGHWILNDGPSSIPASHSSVTVSPVDANGIVTISVARPKGKYTLVPLNSPLQEYPLPTRWDWEFGNQDNSRGRFLKEGNDGIFVMGFDPNSIPSTNPDAPGFGGGDPSLVEGLDDTDTSNPHYYRTAKWNLFDDGTPMAAMAKAPGRERFVAENYSVSKVTNIAATRYSDLARRYSGHPVRHLDDIGLAQSGLPYFQVVHAHILEYDDPTIDGKENSLATFILPPGWDRPTPQDCTASGTYPVLFLPFYDINQTTFNKDNGLRVLNSIAEVLNADRTHETIGIIWNGGATAPAQTTHESVDANLDLMFCTATTELDASRSDIVAIGGSRGGTGALHAAANLVSTNYSIAYAYCEKGQVAYGDVHRRLGTSTYPLLQDSMRKATGFKDGWRQDWANPAPDPAIAAFMDPTQDMDRRITSLNVLTGFPPGPGTGFSPSTDMFQWVDDNRAPMSSARMSALQNNGTQVFLNLPSHDFVNTFSSHVEFVRAARLLNIPVQLELNYREGHGARVSDPLTEVDLLQRLHTPGTYPSLSGNTLYRQDSGPGDMVPISPDTWPMMIELPQEAIAGDALTMTLAGHKGTKWQLEVRVGSSEPNGVAAGQKAVAKASSGNTSGFALLAQGQLGASPSTLTPMFDTGLDNLVTEVLPLDLPFQGLSPNNHTFFEYRLLFRKPGSTTEIELSEHFGQGPFTAHAGLPAVLDNYKKQLIWVKPVGGETIAATLAGRCGGVCEY